MYIKYGRTDGGGEPQAWGFQGPSTLVPSAYSKVHLPSCLTARLSAVTGRASTQASLDLLLPVSSGNPPRAATERRGVDRPGRAPVLLRSRSTTTTRSPFPVPWVGRVSGLLSDVESPQELLAHTHTNTEHTSLRGGVYATLASGMNMAVAAASYESMSYAEVVSDQLAGSLQFPCIGESCM